MQRRHAIIIQFIVEKTNVAVVLDRLSFLEHFSVYFRCWIRLKLEVALWCPKIASFVRPVINSLRRSFFLNVFLKDEINCHFLCLKCPIYPISGGGDFDIGAFILFHGFQRLLDSKQ